MTSNLASVAEVELLEHEVKGNLLEDSSTRILAQCHFCEKEAIAYYDWYPLLENMNGVGKNYCTFCLRHDYHTRKNQNVLITSLRSIIGYLYHSTYKIPFNPSLYLCELKEMIEIHRQIGLMNPAFNYDEESYCWFIDFGKIGTAKRKINLSYVKETISEMHTAFNMFEHIESLNLVLLIKKYHDAIDDFFQSRARPEGKKILIPTLKGCAETMAKASSTGTASVTTKRIPIEECRDFLPFMLVKKSKF